MRLTNIMVFSVALAFVLVDWVSPPNLLLPQQTSWPVAESHLVVVDGTGDAAWHQAITQGTQSWDDAGARIKLSAASGGAPCRYDGPVIEVCEEPFAVLARSDVPDIQGLTRTALDGHHHIRGAIIEICSDCDLSVDRRLVIATHELGHAMGLVHTLDPTSIMFPVGGPDHPSLGDDAALRKLYPPVG
ncbi:MAG: matrixin family metalloprotease [Actinomycetota bacterium]|nr:matrixin family metalloprotease [Actinomycetota bacterium]